MAAKVTSLTATPIEVDPALFEEFTDVLGDLTADDIFPLNGEVQVSMVLDGLTKEYGNAIQRAVMDEIEGICLTFPDSLQNPVESSEDGYHYLPKSNEFTVERFIWNAIRQIPVTQNIPEDAIDGDDPVLYELHIRNDDEVPLNVYSRDLVQVSGPESDLPRFNPFFPIALVEPGKQLRITGIRFQRGIGRDEACFNVGVRGMRKPLDIDEYPLADQIREGLPTESVQLSDFSGFKVNPFVADSRSQLVQFILTAVPRGEELNAAKSALAAVCDRIISVTDLVRSALREDTYGAAQFVETAYSGRNTDGEERVGRKGVLTLPGGTHTDGMLLRRALYDLGATEPGDFGALWFVGYEAHAHEDEMRLTVVVGERDSREPQISALIEATANHVKDVYRAISDQVRS